MLISFVMNVYKEFKLAHSTSKILLDSYPESVLTLILDGEKSALRLEEFSMTEKRVRLQFGERLFTKSGGEWIERWLCAGLGTGADYIVKMDPDTIVRAPLSFIPERPDVIGMIWGIGAKRFIMPGGFQMVKNSAAKEIVSSGFLKDQKYFGEEYTSKRLIEKYGPCYNDTPIFWDVCQRLFLNVYDHPEIFCCIKFPRRFDPKKYNVIHPNNWRLAGYDRAEVLQRGRR